MIGPPSAGSTGAEAPSSDLRAILGIQALRALLYGFGSVVIGSALARAGYTDAQVGLVLTAMLAGAALVSIAVGTTGDRWGRRRVYAGLFGVMAVAGSVFALTDQLWALILAALSGTVSVEANESGPITSLEQAMIAHTADTPAARNRAFGRYNAIAFLTGAVGALLAGGPALFRRASPWLPSDQRFLLVYLPVAVVCAILALRLSPAVEAGEELSTRTRFPLLRSRRTVAKLSGLFALDAFGGGFVVQSFLVFWFERRFGASIETMSFVFFVAGILQGLSSLVAGRVATRIGLLNTMVFTHLPSNLFLIAIPFMPTLPAAVVMMLARSAIGQMDVPARQAYVVTVVEPAERTAAAAYTNTARYLVRPFGPALAGALMTSVGLAAPFVVAGTLKSAYDMLLLANFRRTPERPITPPSSA